MMAESGLRILSADDLEEAAQKAVRKLQSSDIKQVRVAQIMELAEKSQIGISFELPLWFHKFNVTRSRNGCSLQ